MCPLCTGEKFLLKHSENNEKESNNTNYDDIDDMNQEIYDKYREQESLDEIIEEENKIPKQQDLVKKVKIYDFFKRNSDLEENHPNKRQKANDDKIIKNKTVFSIKEQLKAIDQHKKTVDHQKKMFKLELEYMGDKKCMIVIDFKENLRIGGGPVETKANFFTQKQISDLGIAVIYKNKKGYKEVSYYNYFSEILTHDSVYSADCLKELLIREEMKSFEDISIWSDGGNHFRSQEFLGSIFEELNIKLHKNIKMNYFAEYHGKSLVDGHFGLITKWLKECMTTNYINTIDDLKTCFSKKEIIRQEMAKYAKSETNSDQSKFYFLEYKREARNAKKSYIFENSKHYLSFFIHNKKLYASYFTYLHPQNYINIIFKKTTQKDERPTKRGFSKSNIKTINSKNFVGPRVLSIQKLRSIYMKV